MTPQEIFEKLQTGFGEEVVFNFDDGTGKSKDAWCEVAPDRVGDICEKMKTDADLRFDYLECVTGIDFPKEEQIQVVYHIYSYKKKHRMVLKTNLDRSDPILPTVTHVWSAANWHERECYDLLGVLFDGHPELRRLLLPDDWEGHPLRKDWKEKEHYHGIPTTRPNPLDLLGGGDDKAKAKPAAAKAKPAAAKAKPAAAKAKPAAAKAEAKPAGAEDPAAKAKS